MKGGEVKKICVFSGYGVEDPLLPPLEGGLRSLGYRLVAPSPAELIFTRPAYFGGISRNNQRRTVCLYASPEEKQAAVVFSESCLLVTALPVSNANLRELIEIASKKFWEGGGRPRAVNHVYVAGEEKDAYWSETLPKWLRTLGYSLDYLPAASDLVLINLRWLKKDYWLWPDWLGVTDRSVVLYNDLPGEKEEARRVAKKKGFLGMDVAPQSVGGAMQLVEIYLAGLPREQEGTNLFVLPMGA